jgi:Tol biopolymer transport system component
MLTLAGPVERSVRRHIIRILLFSEDTHCKLIHLFSLLLLLSSLPLACGPTVDQPAQEAPGTAVAPTETAVPDEPTGSLVYIQYENNSQVLIQYDLVTGSKLPLFRGLPRGWILQSEVSPDGQQIIIAYSHPPEENGVQLGQFKLYLMPADGSQEPALLELPASAEEIFASPAWAPDNQHIYYSHLVPNPQNLVDYLVTIERLDLETGEAVSIVDSGLWPRISQDGRKLTYVAFDPETRLRSLQVARADGSNPQLLADSTLFQDIDAPLFSPDGDWVYFGAVLSEQSSSLSWFDRLLGVRLAAAHNVPSDWWRVPAIGGEPERLTSVNETGMAGSFSPDGRYFAFSSINGLYVMKPDGSELNWLVKTSAGPTLSWIP